ncbi:MAG: hypothetical protein M3P70_13095, partial [Actinomycetota bacterium]|nr:hypothetical protein [Actinomycetota bacterium]
HRSYPPPVGDEGADETRIAPGHIKVLASTTTFLSLVGVTANPRWSPLGALDLLFTKPHSRLVNAGKRRAKIR